MLQIINQYVFRNAVSVVPLIAQGCQTIVQATLGLRRLYGEQRCKCCTFSAQSTIYSCVYCPKSYYEINVSTP